MLVLAVETATDAVGVALADEGGLAAEVTVVGGRRHAETVAPAVEFACRQAGRRLREVGALVVDVGPGLFTGLRVGVGTAKGLAQALGVGVVPVSSLETLAGGAARAGLGAGAPGTRLWAVVDARRGEVFAAPFRLGPGAAAPDGPERRWRPEELAEALGPGPLVLAGDGARRHLGRLAGPGRVWAGPALDHPPVAALAELGRARALEGGAVPAVAVTARYRREADARINWSERLPPRPAPR